MENSCALLFFKVPWEKRVNVLTLAQEARIINV